LFEKLLCKVFVIFLSTGGGVGNCQSLVDSFDGRVEVVRSTLAFYQRRYQSNEVRIFVERFMLQFASD